MENIEIMLPQITDNLNLTMQYKQMMCFCQSGIDQLTVKLQILRNEFQTGYDRNPIKEISSRIKSPESILEKMQRKKFPYTTSCMINHIHDIAMDFWAGTEHQLRYKKDRDFTKDMEAQLKTCADLMADADIRMQKLASTLGVG